MTTPTLKIGTSGYKIDPKKLAKAPQYITPYLFLGAFYYNEDYQYFDKIKPYLDIPEQPKTLDEIQQEFEQKIDAQVEKFKICSQFSRENAEERYNRKFNRIAENFEYAKEHGEFPTYLKFAVDGRGLGAYAGLGCQTSFIIKQGDNNPGYYTMGNRKFFKFYMPYKPNAVVRFFMKTCLGFVWEDESNV